MFNAVQAFQRGAAHYNRGEDERAEAAFTVAIQFDSKPFQFYLFRGLSRLRLGRIRDALIDLNSTLDRNPECVDAAWARGRINANQGDHAAAARDFGRVIVSKPTDQLAYSARGEMYYRLRDWPRCFADYRQAAALSPDDPKVLNRLAWVLATSPADEYRNGPAALELAERANRLMGGNDPLILDTLAAAYGECGQFSNATTVLKQALSLADELTYLQLLEHQSAFEAGRPWRD